MTEIETELHATLRQIGPATFREVALDVRGRIRLGLIVLLSPSGDLLGDLQASWDSLAAAKAIEDLGVGGRFGYRPIAPAASADRQMNLFS